MKQKIDTFLKKEMTRKEFVRHLGLLMLSVIGLSGVLKYLAENDTSSYIKNGPNSYGRNFYGGDRSRL